MKCRILRAHVHSRGLFCRLKIIWNRDGLSSAVSPTCFPLPDALPALLRSNRIRSFAVAPDRLLRPGSLSRLPSGAPEHTSGTPKHTSNLQQRTGSYVLALLVAILGLLLLISAPQPAIAQDTELSTPQTQTDADPCQTEYEEARELYFSAEFEPAIRLLETCLDAATLRAPTKARMYRMLAFSYLGNGDGEKARLAVENLLDNDPDYKPDPVQDRPDFVRLIQNVRKEREQVASSDDGGRGWVKWVVGAAGVITLGVLAAVLGGGGGGGGSDIDDD